GYRRPVRVLEGQGRRGRPEEVRDVLGPDCLLGEAALEGATHRGVAVDLQEIVELLDIVNPPLRPPMRELRQVGERGGSEIEQMLPLEISPRALPRTCRHALGAMLRQDRTLTRLELPRVIGPEAARDDPHAV